ncbi:MAG: T9SS type A sorting domain-containing protein [Chitinophagales bacterium]
MKIKIKQTTRSFFSCIAGKTITFLFAILFAVDLTTGYTQNTWTQKADFGGTARLSAVGFSIGSKGYLGTGYDNWGHYKKDFWEYDPDADTWTQKADFGGTPRTGAVGFSISSKGYLGTGDDGNGDYYKDFWEYDPDANSWMQKADFGGTGRYLAVGFSIGSKGYVGTGSKNNNYKKDFWEYDPDTNTWTQKADFGGTACNGAVGFGIGSKGYLGTGVYYDNTYHYYKDFWEYDPNANSWTQKADFGGTARALAVGFSIASKGYLGTGSNYPTYYKDFWKYDPDANTWMQQMDFGGTVRRSAIGFSIGSKGYLGTGEVYPDYYKDFWEYTLDFGVGIPLINHDESALSVFPNPSNGAIITYLKLNNGLNAEVTVEVLNLLGKKVYSQQVQLLNGMLQKEIQLDEATTEGMYLVKVIINDQVYSSQISYQK